MLLGKNDNPLVHNDVLVADWLLQNDTFERSAATQSDIYLPGRKRSSTQINDDFVEGLALTFVNRNRPSQAKRKLCETADDLCGDFFFGLII